MNNGTARQVRGQQLEVPLTTCLVTLLLLVTPAIGLAQSGWTHQVGQSPSIGDPTPIMSVLSPMTCSNGTEQFPSGAYVKSIPSYPYTSVRFDAVATNTGTCLNYYNGNYSSTDDNGINSFEFHPILPDGTSGGYAYSGALWCNFLSED